VSVRSSEEITTLCDRLAPVYDLIYGVTLNHGRRLAMTRLAPHPGETILEVGVGTGLSAVKYPDGCHAIAIDVSSAMISRARARLRRRRIEHVVLCRMDAAQLAFPDSTFDAVYAPYVMNVVPDPVRVAREMVWVCRPSGRLVIVNRFGRNEPSLLGGVMDRLTPRVGFQWRLDLATLLRESNLVARSIEPAKVPRFATVVVCGKRPFLEDDFA
jgi:phosphatidylethanolamine/phosphatidyl-N-methylethanolamine N-methyltransferase